ncbi:MAG: CC_3452 family protein [Caulobacteraceae bacterium]
MKLRLATACAVIVLGLAGSALADGRVIATLESPQAPRKDLIAANAVWNCADSTCVAQLAPDDSGTLDGCKELARKVGRLTAYKEFKPLDAKTLAKCNAAAGAPRIGTASR